ncbi:MAG: hypothetical protein M3132_04960 [Actinomycetia bacterium]|nr:hypothetical protein [Actinomycetes bacterium]
MPDVQNWTIEQWDDWYQSVVEPGWRVEDASMAASEPDLKGLYEIENYYGPLSDKYPPELVSSFMEIRHNYDHGGGTPGSMAFAFLEMPKESRIRFYQQWQEAFGDPGAATAEQAEWADPAAVGTMVSLPDGNVGDLSDQEFETTDGTFIPAPNTVKKALIVAGVAGAVAVIAVLVLLFNGGDSAPESVESSGSSINLDQPCEAASGCTETEPIVPADDGSCDVTGTCEEVVVSDCGVATGCDADEPAAVDAAASDDIDLTWVSEDPFRDLFRTSDDLDAIDPDRELDGVSGQDFMEVVDLVGMTVTSKGGDNLTEIILEFAGGAEDIRTEEFGNLSSRSISGDVIITPPEGRSLNVLYRPDGKIKISDIPTGMSITSEWVTPNELIVTIIGLALNPGTQVEAAMLYEAYGGFMSDVVTLLLTAS